MKNFTCASNYTTSNATQSFSEACLDRAVRHQAGNSPADHRRFFIFGIFAPFGAYLNQGGNDQTRRDPNYQIKSNSLRFIYFFKGVFND